MIEGFSSKRFSFPSWFEKDFKSAFINLTLKIRLQAILCHKLFGKIFIYQYFSLQNVITYKYLRNFNLSLTGNAPPIRPEALKDGLTVSNMTEEQAMFLRKVNELDGYPTLLIKMTGHDARAGLSILFHPNGKPQYVPSFFIGISTKVRLRLTI